MRLFCTLAVLWWLRGAAVDAQEASPCPRLFTYEKKGPEPDRWYGVLTLLNDADLTGVWLRVIFDRPIIQLGNWFGDVVLHDHKDFLIRNRNFRLKAHTPKTIRIFVRYNTKYPPPKLQELRLNAKTVCPEELATTTPSTTTEQLFTSLELAGDEGGTENASGSGGAFISNSVYPSTTTSKVYVASPPTPEQVEQTTRAQDSSLRDVSVDEICGTVADLHRQDRHIGQVARKGEFPWHVALYYTKGIVIAYLCGASLVSRYHVITVAHCVIKSQSQSAINPERLVVYLGKHYVKHWQHDGTQTRYVDAIASHPDYDSETYNNDISVLKLSSAVDFTNNVRPVCLWRESLDFSSVANRPGTVVGWGFDENGKIEDKLMQVQMIAQSPDVCGGSFANYSTRFTSLKTYCASFVDDTAECVGDSGGGMVYPRLTGNITSSVWQLRGLVTVSVVLQHQLKCDRSHFVVFTDVAKYIDWITETMK